MPSYRSHAIHVEEVMRNVSNRVVVDKEDVKLFSMGPDPLMYSAYKTFDYQHAHQVRDFFTSMIIDIKKYGLQNNPKVMAFLYGQIAHLVLDSTMHPLIYFLTQGKKSGAKLGTHGLSEIWIDDYVCKKYGIKGRKFYKQTHIGDEILKDLINTWYKEVFGVKHASFKYNVGYSLMILFDKLVRRNPLSKPLIKAINVGDVSYEKDTSRAKPYLNHEHNVWINPETAEASHESFDEVWNRAIRIATNTINQVNDFLYRDKPFSNILILNDTSYNTGLSCKEGQTLRFTKRYK